MQQWSVERIVAGGQTGVDQAALGWARERGIEFGGWAPAHWNCESADGTDPRGGQIPGELKQLMQATLAEDEKIRTWKNVCDSDGTVIFTLQPDLFGGTLETLVAAERLEKPCCHLARDADLAERQAMRLLSFLSGGNRYNVVIRRLNVAGPRHSTEPGVGNFARELLELAYVRGAAEP